MTPDRNPNPRRPITRRERELFDRLLEGVLADLPDQVHEVLQEAPLVVDDYPSPQDRHAVLGDDEDDDLCGLYHGTALPDRSLDQPEPSLERIQVYRAGILDLVEEQCGRIDPAELQRQIRITILHEVGHHFGLDEDDLAELGYD